MKPSEPLFPFQVKRSHYFETVDGTRLAYDLILPAAEEGIPAEGPFPAILIVSRGGRFDPEKGNGDVFANACIPYGYAAAVLELRGCGASFGTCDSFASVQDRQDVAAFIGWLAAQDWCTGRVGMTGISNRAFIQLAAAVEQPEALKLITPTVAITDFYYQNYPNGVSAMPVLKNSAAPVKLSREDFLQRVRPTDEDPEGDLAYEAYCRDQFGKNRFFVGNLLYPNMNRDTPNPNLNGERTNLTIPPYTYREQLKHSGIRQHQFIGQLESGTLGQLANYREMGGSFTLGPWTHFQSRLGNPDVPEGMIPFNDAYRTIFDAVLKEEDNGFDQMPPATYYVFGAKEGEHWRVSDSWPLENERRAVFYLTPELSGSWPAAEAGGAGSAAQDTVPDGSGQVSGAASGGPVLRPFFDGSLSLTPPAEETRIEYPVNTGISVFDNHDGAGATYNRMRMCWDGDMAPDVDAKGLTFTTKPFFPVYENLMAGCVSVDLWVTSTAPDGDFIAYLEEVRADGTSRYLKDGVIRASHRTSGPNPAWEALGATWHTSMTEDVERCLAKGMKDPVHLQFAIEPIAVQFAKGSRLRLTITCADPHTFQHPMYEDGLPVISLCTGGDHPSFISVPFVEHEENVYNGQVSLDGYEGPGTLYFFNENVYLQAGGTWKRLSAADGTASYRICGYEAIFEKAGFRFRMEGNPVKDGIYQNYQGGGETLQPLPAFRHLFLDAVPVADSAHSLFVPTVKTLKMDVFRDPASRSLPAGSGTAEPAGPCREPEAPGLSPAIINIHGYGGSYSVFTAQHRVLYEAGYAVVGIDLRNYPPNPFPDYIHDVKGAIRFIRVHAREWGIDPDRIGCYGLSLGGNSTLMAAVSAGEPELEGSVGGNAGVSSRLQAAVAGFAWTDLLTMGPDIADEYAGDPDAQQRKTDRTDGAFAPCAEAIGYAGPGKGMAVLRQYLEEGREGTDPGKDAALAAARYASPINHITADCPPIALFAGYGAPTVDIAMQQTLRTFRKLHESGATAFLFANTGGEYGKKPEIIHAVKDFFDRWL